MFFISLGQPYSEADRASMAKNYQKLWKIFLSPMSQCSKICPPIKTFVRVRTPYYTGECYVLLCYLYVCARGAVVCDILIKTCFGAIRLY